MRRVSFWADLKYCKKSHLLFYEEGDDDNPEPFWIPRCPTAESKRYESDITIPVFKPLCQECVKIGNKKEVRVIHNSTELVKKIWDDRSKKHIQTR